MRGSVRSSAKRVAPVTFATASTFRSALPMMLRAAIQRFPRRLCFLAAHARRRQLDGLVDLDVAGTATEVAGECVLDLVARGPGVGEQQRFGREQEGRGAVAALRRAEIGGRLLQRV